MSFNIENLNELEVQSIDEHISLWYREISASSELLFFVITPLSLLGASNITLKGSARYHKSWFCLTLLSSPRIGEWFISNPMSSLCILSTAHKPWKPYGQYIWTNDACTYQHMCIFHSANPSFSLFRPLPTPFLIHTSYIGLQSGVESVCMRRRSHRMDKCKGNARGRCWDHHWSVSLKNRFATVPWGCTPSYVGTKLRTILVTTAFIWRPDSETNYKLCNWQTFSFTHLFRLSPIS